MAEQVEDPKKETEDQEIKPDQPIEIDTDKTIEKLQKRLGKEQADKNDYKEKFEKLEEQLKKLRNGSDDPEKDKPDAVVAEKDKTIQELQNELKKAQNGLKIAEVKQKTSEVFAEAGLNVNKDILDIVADVDNEQTYAKAKALIEFANKIKDDTRKELQKGKTPTVSSASSAKITSLDGLTLLERSQLADENPELFNQLSHKS